MSGPDDISNNAGPGSAAEPSMEEILDSIRRIMRDDGTPAPAPVALDDEVLVLDASMIARPGGLPSGTGLAATPETLETQEPDGPGQGYAQSGHIASDPALTTAPDTAANPADAPPLVRPDEAMYMPPDQSEPAMSDHIQPPESLLGEDARDATKGSIGALVRSLGNERAVAVSRGGITLEDIVRDEIRPMLKSWLDAHLPSLVERIVRSEIERVIDRNQI